MHTHKKSKSGERAEQLAHLERECLQSVGSLEAEEGKEQLEVSQALDLHAGIGPDYIEQCLQGHLHFLDAYGVLTLLARVYLTVRQLHHRVEILRKRERHASG